LQLINIIEKILVDDFQESGKKQLLVMHERTLTEAVIKTRIRVFIEKSHGEAFSDVIQYALFVFDGSKSFHGFYLQDSSGANQRIA
jgi:hypothetical protein